MLFVPHQTVLHYYGSNNPEPSFLKDGSSDYILIFLFNSEEFKKTHLTPRTQKKRLFNQSITCPYFFFPFFWHLVQTLPHVNLPVERTGRFWTLIPKLFRGSSFSRDGSSWDAGAGTAVDCTDRAGDSSLELLLESLLRKAQGKRQVSARRHKGILIKKQNTRAAAGFSA